MAGCEVVVTSVGVVSAFGQGQDALAEGIREGRTALAPLRAFDAQNLPVGLAAEIPGMLPELPDFEDDRKAVLAHCAALEAMAGQSLPSRTGVWLGTGLSSVTSLELAQDVYPHLHQGVLDRAAVIGDVAGDRVAPRRHLPERVTAALAELAGATGPQSTSFSACAAGAQAIAEAFRAVARQEVEVALCGGHDSMIHPLGVLSFVVLGALSEQRCRPFDRERSGFSIGEGAAVLVLESEERARRRGATVLARILGAGTSVDAWRPTAPHSEGRGAVLAMRRALADAGLSPDQVDHVNAHGTGTPLGDAVEARAVAEVLGEGTPLCSNKGAIGHCIAAAGAMEAAVCVAALGGGWTPGTVGHESPEDWPVEVRRETREDAPSVILSNSFGFGGQNCALVFSRA